MAWLFGTTLFVSALLLFLVQPMIAKMLLPLLGGAPAVWNTCMVFFQAGLLAGYAYAHWSVRLRWRWQLALHAVIMVGAVLPLPLAVGEGHVRALAEGANPSLWLLGCLAGTVGLPYFAVAATSPLLQRWFSRTRHAESGDPYFLYGASNLGSLLALLSYPVLFEPNLRLSEQSHFWAFGYGLLALLILTCAAFARRDHKGIAVPVEESDALAPGTVDARIAPEVSVWRQRSHWIALAFVPSSLMLGVTNYLGTDIASIPLLWIVPLALYLLTFILGFGRRRWIPLRWFARAVPVGALALGFLILTRATQPVALLILIHLTFFWVAGMLCHGRLWDLRPGADRLTEFYLILSAGGVLGGLFNALVAPNLFSSVTEYPLAIIMACLLRPGPTKEPVWRIRTLDLALPVLLGLITIGTALVATWLDVRQVNLRNVLVIGLPAVLSFLFVDRTVRFALSLGIIFVLGGILLSPYGRTLHVERNFFGVSRVTQGRDAAFRHMIHGNTLHGRQFVEPQRQCEPLTYYHRTGPLGDVFEIYEAKPASPEVAVIGLGAGSMFCYSQSDQRWTFYEIDPAVIRIAQNTNYFTFLRRCGLGGIRIVMGDARLRLAEATPGQYGLIVLDAFSSDAIPAHLLTREALRLYLSKLADGGLLAFHISNRYLDLEPVVGELAHGESLACRTWDDSNLTGEDRANGKEESHWVVLARKPEDFGRLNRVSQWLPVQRRPGMREWADDFTNISSVFKWR